MFVTTSDAFETPSFAGKLATLDHVLAVDLFAQVSTEVAALTETERSHLPTHKKGGTVAYSVLRENAPTLVGHYHSATIRSLVSRIVGVEVKPTPLHDESSCSVLFYEKPGDHINWHYDHNFYRGRHFTVLIPIVNRGRDGGLSAARLLAKQGGRDVEVATPPNRLILFEGAKVRHKVTPINEGERRAVWSMTYCTDPRNSAFQGAARERHGLFWPQVALDLNAGQSMDGPLSPPIELGLPPATLATLVFPPPSFTVEPEGSLL